jgi:hypothetical protein
MSARYHAPAVAYVFVRPGWAGGLVLTGMVLLMALLVWCLQVQSGWLQVLLALPALILAAVLLCGQWRNWPQGRLLWNGEHWLLEAENLSTARSLPVRLAVGLDGGHWLWLSVSDVLVFRTKGGRRRCYGFSCLNDTAPSNGETCGVRYIPPSCRWQSKARPSPVMAARRLAFHDTSRFSHSLCRQRSGSGRTSQCWRHTGF